MKQFHGFTLIELSIVLVIIGLLAGGILLGRDLIMQAEIRATVSQIEGYKAAYFTFRTKYNCIPGDCINSNEFGLGGIPGNGNGVLDICVGCDAGLDSSEPNFFWRHLANANLVSDRLMNFTNLALPAGQPLEVPYAKASASVYTLYYPQSGIAPNLKNTDGSAYITLVSDRFNSCAGETNCPAISPEFAYGMDSKMDDGLPKTGTVRSYGGWSTYSGGGTTSEGASGGDFCTNTSVTPFAYNILNRKLLCVPFIRFM